MNKINRKWWKRYLTKRGFQSRQLLRLAGLTMISVFLSTIGLWMFYNGLIDRLSAGDLPFFFTPDQMQAMSDQIPGVRETALKWIIIMSGLNMVIVIFVGAFITNKLGGPLYQFNLTMKKIAEGDLNIDIRLRKGDEFKDLAENINNATARLQIMIMSIQENVEVIERLRLQPANQQILQQSLAGIREALSYFQTVEITNPEVKRV